MRIAIVGGGAGGLVAAYLLGDRHEVDLYEAAPHVGGHVRTLGQNVAVDMPPGKVSENGPLGFHVASSPTLMRLLTELHIETKPTGLGSNLFLRDDRHFCHFSYGSGLHHWLRRFGERKTGGLKTAAALAKFFLQTRPARANGHAPLADVLPRPPHLRDWFRCVVMMCCSMPAGSVDSLPVSFAGSNLRNMLLYARWVFIPGGMYSYQAELLSRFGGRVLVDSPVDRVFRDDRGVTLSVNGATTPPYDKLIVATSPGRVLSMLDRPTATEAKCFSAWGSDISFRTIAHADQTLYEGKDSVCPSAADYFEREDGDFGYNTSVSSLYSGTNEFGFAYNLDELIDPAKRLDSHEHQIPAFSPAALAHREELIDTSGASNTYYVGAYLGSSMHEAAVSSASRASRLLGGRSLGDGGSP